MEMNVKNKNKIENNGFKQINENGKWKCVGISVKLLYDHKMEKKNLSYKIVITKKLYSIGIIHN